MLSFIWGCIIKKEGLLEISLRSSEFRFICAQGVSLIIKELYSQ